MPDRRAFITSSATLAAAALLPGVARGAPLAPFKLYDTHAHFHGTDLARYPFRVDIDPVRRERALAQPVTPEILFKAWDDAGVEMGCGVQFNTTYATDNAYLLDVAEQYPGRVAPVVILSPTDPATPASLKSMAKAYGIVGVRFSGLPDAEGRFAFLGEDAQRSWGTANDLGLVVVLMPLGSPPQPSALPAAMKRIGALADRYPRLNIVLDHFGFPVAERTPTFGFSPDHLALAAHKNVHHKYSTFLLELLRRGGVPDREFLNYVIGVYGTANIVWGSDFGNTPGDLAAFAKRALDSAANLTLAQKRAIFYGNAKRLFVSGGPRRARAALMSGTHRRRGSGTRERG